MPQLDSDAFTYSNGALATVSSAKWTKASLFADLNVTSNQLQGAGAGNDKVGVIATWGGSTTDQYSQVVVSGSSLAFAGPTVHSDGTGTFYLLELNVDGTHCQVTKCVAGTYTTLQQFVAQAVAGDIAYLEWVGGTLNAKINGVSIGTKADSAIASGKPGIRIFDSGSSVIVDDWAAGDFSAAGITYPELERGTRGVGRGIVTGVVH